MTADVLVPPPLSEDWVWQITERGERAIVIEANGLGVRYDGTAGVAGLALPLTRLMRRRPPRSVWALRDVDLIVRAGECVGIIGRNGAGKSTLLRVIAGLIQPDAGSMSVHGRVSALLNLGVGFDPNLTGRANVQLVGSLMGLRRSETRTRVPRVVDFAGIGEAIDAPLRTYSSGMRARLGFATAAEMIEPHVLLLDEVMGTGDAEFRERSRQRVTELVRGAHAVMVTSHDMAWVSEFASYAMLLDAGHIVAEGAPSGVTALHRARSVQPPRRFGCDECGGRSQEGYCLSCGVWRRRKD